MTEAAQVQVKPESGCGTRQDIDSGHDKRGKVQAKNHFYSHAFSKSGSTGK
jgi:hypothetical protein